ncbi:MAG TPA: hypothetical protein PLN73_00355, partial [Microbacteriaceae bacterium]|nr:hypothetical protein [Microbacteriaceae bacterium]
VIYGFMLTGSFTGTGIGVPVWGVVYDLTGEFTLAMYAGGAVGLIGLLFAYLGLHRGLRHRASLNETVTTGVFLPEDAEVAAAASASTGTAPDVDEPLEEASTR